jgi:uncharacterized membrane protein YfbV (UPF0208 family)
MPYFLDPVPASVQAVNPTQSKTRRRPLLRDVGMPNRIDKRLAPILRDVKGSRDLLPNEPVTDDQLYFDWIRGALDEIEKTLEAIDTKKVIVVQKAGKPTDDILEEKLRKAIKQIDDTHGILYSVDEIFKNQIKHSAEILDRTRQIRATALTMRRQLKRVTSSVYWFFRSWKLVVLLFVIGFLLIAAVGVYRAESGKPPVQAVTEQFQKDTEKLRRAATNTTGLERVVKVTEQLKEMGQLVPAILVAVASMLTAVKGIWAAVQAFKT